MRSEFDAKLAKKQYTSKINEQQGKQKLCMSLKIYIFADT